MASINLPRQVKRALKPHLKSFRSFLIRKVYRFDKADLLSALQKIGICPGDVLMVHSSWDRFEGFTGSITDAIEALQEAVGVQGILMMPTLGFGGSALDYASEGKTFDVKRTPSRMGLLSEMFRRSPGVVRSVHPTHSVAGWGGQAQEFVAGHERATTPCGAGSPWRRLGEHGGKILLLGTGIGSMTFYHAVEDIIEHKIPLPVFTEETYRLLSKDLNANMVYTTTRLFNRDVSRRRDLTPLAEEIKKAGHWKEQKVGRLSLVALKAEMVLKTTSRMADAGLYCYQS